MATAALHVPHRFTELSKTLKSPGQEATSSSLAATLRQPQSGRQPPLNTGVSSAQMVSQLALREDRDASMMNVSSEAQWMLTTLDDMCSKLALVSYLTPDILKDKIVDALDAETLIALRLHFQAEKEYVSKLKIAQLGLAASNAEAAAVAAGLGGLASEGGEDVAEATEAAATMQTQLLDHELYLADSMRTVARLLRQHPLLARRVREVAQARSSSAVSFATTFARLRPVLYTTLKETADEERRAAAQLAQRQRQSEEAQAEFARLQQEYTRSTATHMQALAERDAQIAEVKAQVDSLARRDAHDTAELSKWSAEQQELADKAFKGAESGMQRDLKALHTQLATDGDDRYDAELQRQRLLDRRDGEVADAVARYDTAMLAKQKRLERLLLAYDKETRELQRLNVYFAARKAEDARTQAELARIVDTRNRELRVERLRHENELFMESLVGGFEDRNAKQAKAAAKAAKAKAAAKAAPGGAKPGK